MESVKRRPGRVEGGGQNPARFDGAVLDQLGTTPRIAYYSRSAFRSRRHRTRRPGPACPRGCQSTCPPAAQEVTAHGCTGRERQPTGAWGPQVACPGRPRGYRVGKVVGPATWT